MARNLLDVLPPPTEAMMTPESEMEAGPRPRDSRRATHGARLWIVAAAVLTVLGAAWMILPVQELLGRFTQWVDGFGPLSGVIYTVIYILGAVVMAPGAALSIGAGLIFGLAGLPVAVTGATLGACTAFLVSRHLARASVRERIRGHRHFTAVDRAIGDKGWKVVLLLRLSPVVPYNFVNYLLGATRVGFWPHALATAAGVIPCTLMFVWIGAAGHTALTSLSNGNGPTRWLVLGAGLAVSAAVTALVTRAARRRLQRAGLEG